jgi:hypothetical protein
MSRLRSGRLNRHPIILSFSCCLGAWRSFTRADGLDTVRRRRVLVFEAIVIGLQETADAHDLTAARWFALVTVLILMAAVYCAQFVVAARWARRHL